MFEAVKVVSPSSSLSLAFPPHQLSSRQKTIKTFLIFHNPMLSEKKESSSSSKQKPRYRSWKPSRRQNVFVALSAPHLPKRCKKTSENLVIYLKMIIFKERNRRTQQILVIFYSFNGRRKCSEHTSSVGGEKEEKCSWWFYGSITNFLYVLLLKLGVANIFSIQMDFHTVFLLTHLHFFDCVREDENLPLHKSIHPLLFLCFCFFYYLFYDCIKWPIVKVNDSQRHKIAHFLLWLLSIILFNDKLGLT